MGDEMRRTYADDVVAITQQIYRYCRSMDRMDADLGYSVWHPEGTADYGVDLFQGTGREFIDHVTQLHKPMTVHSHQISNVLVEVSGDMAGSESYVMTALRFEDAEGIKEYSVRGRYLDRWSFRNDRWAIDHRQYVHDFDDVRRIEQQQQPTQSSRDPSDPSYGVLKI